MSTPRRLGDATPGEWVNERLLGHEPFGRVGSVVPTGFERVVRVLHPPGEGRSWAEVAAASGRRTHPLVQWGSIAAHVDDGSSDIDPDVGSIPVETLAAVLEHCPAEGEVVYAVWVGFGRWVDRGDARELMPGWGGRDYLLFAAPRAPLTSWPGLRGPLPQSANLIWPQDQTWCIATEIDYDSTLLAASAVVADAVLADDRLEAFPVAYDDDLSWTGDRVNPPPPRRP